ncbi:hypothetical protein [Corallococcus terminator]|uniref:hypothetical protein n=1 Tax=Corallococcus terminator TaxID=2316733 RepID=UPI00131575BC|nr:hypothetical protein [Corallococcus terminator]
MNRLLTLVVPFALLMGTGCVVDGHYHRPTRAAYVAPVVQYRFAGAHPVPDDYGSGWCPEDYSHVHDYQPPQASYVYTDDVYYYRGPTLVWYWDYHPIPSGGYCSFHGRHSHDFYPHGSWGHGYSYDRGTRGYRWDRTHAASAGNIRYNTGPSRQPAPYNGNSNVGRRGPPGGTGTGARPPSGSSNSGWGRSNAAPAANSRRDNDDDNKGSGWSSPGNSSKSRDDDKDNDSPRSSGNSGSSGGGWSSPGSSSGSSGSSNSGSSGSSGSGRSNSGGSSGSSGGGWGSPGSSGRSSSGSSGSSSGSSGSSGGRSSGSSGRSSGSSSGGGGWNTGR